MTPNVLPCPFCGQPPQVSSYPTVAFISCKHKYCSIRPMAQSVAQTSDEALASAIEKWNHRKEGQD